MMTGYIPQIARGHEEPFAVQFSVFLANRVGQLRELLSMLEQEEVAIAGLSIVDSTDWAVVRIVFLEPLKGREVLSRHDLPFTESQVLLVVLDAGQETLGEVCRLLVSAECNIHFAYPLMIQRNDSAVLVLHVEDRVLATQVLIKHDIAVVGYEDLRGR